MTRYARRVPPKYAVVLLSVAGAIGLGVPVVGYGHLVSVGPAAYCGEQPTPRAAQTLSEGGGGAYSIQRFPFGITCSYGGASGTRVVQVYHDQGGFASLAGLGLLGAALACGLVRTSAARKSPLAG